MEGNRGLAAIWMTELFVGTPLPDFLETKGREGRAWASRSAVESLIHAVTVCVPMNSVSKRGSPSSRSIVITSRRLSFSSSRLLPWL